MGIHALAQQNTTCRPKRWAWGKATFACAPAGLWLRVRTGRSRHKRYELLCAERCRPNAAVVVQVDAREAQPIRLPASGFARHWNGRRSAGGAAALLLLRRRLEIISQGAHPAALEPFARPMRLACVPRMLRHAFPVLWLLAYGTASSFGRRLKGFDMADAVITAVESRTSAPVRIVRNENGEAPGLSGFYPAGEGAGYAGDCERGCGRHAYRGTCYGTLLPGLRSQCVRPFCKKCGSCGTLLRKY